MMNPPARRLRTPLLASAAVIALLAAATGSTVLAQNLPLPPPSPAGMPRGTSGTPILVRTGQHAEHARVVFHLPADAPRPSIQRGTEGWEVKFAGPVSLDLASIRPVAELAAIEPGSDGSSALLRLPPCDCAVEGRSLGNLFYIDIKAPAGERSALRAAMAGRPATIPPVAARARPVTPSVPTETDDLDAARRRLYDEAIRLGIVTREQADKLVPPRPTTAAAPPRRSRAEQEQADLETLRQSIEARIKALNAPPSPAPAPTATNTPSTSSQPPQAGQPEAGTLPPVQSAANLSGPVPRSPSTVPTPRPAGDANTPGATPPPAPRFVEAPPPPPRPSCPQVSDISKWAGGDTSFADKLVALRTAAARATEGANEMATLAEFFVAHGMPHEAIEIVSAIHRETPNQDLQLRLDRVRDIALLLRGVSIPATSPLLIDPIECQSEDVGLWRTLAAAVMGDTEAATKYAPRARAALRDVPDRLQFALAFAIADHIPDDADALRAIAAGIRNTDTLLPEEEAARYLLLTRIARAEGNISDEILFLRRAATWSRTAPGLMAKTRLASLEVNRPGEIGRTAENTLLDLARTYRFDKIGVEAAVLLAERYLQRGDYANALELLDESAAAGRRRGGDSRVPNLAAKILRALFVEATGPNMPPPSDRTVLFWKYGGFAAPGIGGDDIRLGAIRDMIAAGMPEAATDLFNQLAPSTSNTPRAIILRARADADAPRGDAQRALAALRALPADAIEEHARRTAARALARLGNYADAAKELDGMGGLPDRTTRAGYLHSAGAWTAAAAAYADLLKDSETPSEIRSEATTRYALAAALGRPPASQILPNEMLTVQTPAVRAMVDLAALPPVPPPGTGDNSAVNAARTAIERARRIENLFND